MIHLQMLGEFIVEHPVAILGCIAANMIIGNVWYGPIFGKAWRHFNGIHHTGKPTMQTMLPAMLVSIFTAFVQALVIGRSMQILAIGSWVDPIVITLVLWVPFTLLTFATNYAYLKKPFTLLMIDTGFVLISLWATSLVIYSTAL